MHCPGIQSRFDGWRGRHMFGRETFEMECSVTVSKGLVLGITENNKNN